MECQENRSLNQTLQCWVYSAVLSTAWASNVVFSISGRVMSVVQKSLQASGLRTSQNGPFLKGSKSCVVSLKIYTND